MSTPRTGKYHEVIRGSHYSPHMHNTYNGKLIAFDFKQIMTIRALLERHQTAKLSKTP